MASVNQMGKTHSKPLAARHAMCESAFIVLFLACLSLPDFSTLSQKGRDFRGEKIEHKMCLFIFSTTLSKSFSF